MRSTNGAILILAGATLFTIQGSAPMFGLGIVYSVIGLFLMIARTPTEPPKSP